MFIVTTLLFIPLAILHFIPAETALDDVAYILPTDPLNGEEKVMTKKVFQPNIAPRRSECGFAMNHDSLTTAIITAIILMSISFLGICCIVAVICLMKRSQEQQEEHAQDQRLELSNLRDFSGSKPTIYTELNINSHSCCRKPEIDSHTLPELNETAESLPSELFDSTVDTNRLDKTYQNISLCNLSP